MKAPILSRTLFVQTMRDGSKRLLDFALVGTSLGAMLEPRSIIRTTGAGGMVNEDVYDATFTDIKDADGTMISALGLQAEQWPRTFNTL